MAEDIFSSLSPLSAAYFFILRKLHFSDIVAVGRNQRERAWETASAPARSKSAAAELYCFIRLRTSGRAFSAASTCLSGRMRCIACIQTSPISGRKALSGLLCLIGKHQASQRHFFMFSLIHATVFRHTGYSLSWMSTASSVFLHSSLSIPPVSIKHC